jgi:hypothetical protein
MRYQSETLGQLNRVPEGTVSKQSMNLGMANDEPLLVAMDAMLRYAKAYRKEYRSNLAEDGVLGIEYLQAINGLRGLLNGNGAVAMEKGITTDSKDNGALEAIFWYAIEAGGFTEEDA